jgi:hypothetical protein
VSRVGGYIGARNQNLREMIESFSTFGGPDGKSLNTAYSSNVLLFSSRKARSTDLSRGRRSKRCFDRWERTVPGQSQSKVDFSTCSFSSGRGA